jgi:PEGA domain
MRNLLSAAFVASCVCALTLPATAQEPPGYRDTVEDAISDLAAHRYEEAHALFLRAHALMPSARTYRGLGFAEFELREYVSCIAQLEAALRSGVKPLEGELRKDTERLLARARSYVGMVVIDTKPPATRVVVDGTPAQDRTLPLAVGEHTLELGRDGYQPENRRLHVRGGESQTVSFAFKELPKFAAHEDRQRSWLKNPWLWTAVGVAVAGTAAGVALALRGDSREVADPSGGSTGAFVWGPTR